MPWLAPLLFVGGLVFSVSAAGCVSNVRPTPSDVGRPAIATVGDAQTAPTEPAATTSNRYHFDRAILAASGLNFENTTDWPTTLTLTGPLIRIPPNLALASNGTTLSGTIAAAPSCVMTMVIYQAPANGSVREDLAALGLTQPGTALHLWTEKELLDWVASANSGNDVQYFGDPAAFGESVDDEYVGLGEAALWTTSSQAIVVKATTNHSCLQDVATRAAASRIFVTAVGTIVSR